MIYSSVETKMDTSPLQVQEGCGRLPEIKHGALRDCWSDKRDHEEHGQKAAEPSEKPERQQPGRGGRRHAGERPELSHRLLLALLQLLLLLLRVLWRRGHVVPAQPQRRRLPRLLCDEHHSSHWGRVCRTNAGGLWRYRGLRSRPGSDRSCERPWNGCCLMTLRWVKWHTPGVGYMQLNCYVC